VNAECRRGRGRTVLNKPGGGFMPQRSWLSWLLVAGVVAGSGCRDEELDSTYGKRRGVRGEASVNGTAVLATMFELAGHKVQTRRHLSPRTHEFDVIVWFPDDFQPPAEEAEQFLEDWLYRRGGKTLIYVGRDYDATADYWEKILPTAPPEQRVEILRRLAQARAERSRGRARVSEAKDGRWFRLQPGQPRRYFGRRQDRPPQLQGSWAADGEFQAAEFDVVVETRLEALKNPPNDDYGGTFRSETLLSADGVPLVQRIQNAYWTGGQIIIVTNGSLLLNLPLVEHEHRKLAGKLIAACGPPQKRVLFLESGPEGVPVHEQEPGSNHPTSLEAFTVWPLSAIVLHFVALGTLILASRWTVFGRPRELPRPPVSDFGHHVNALGELLAKTQNPAYAQMRLAEYRRKTAGGAPTLSGQR